MVSKVTKQQFMSLFLQYTLSFRNFYVLLQPNNTNNSDKQL